jgi:uncharacterized protein (TIGR00369 family)
VGEGEAEVVLALRPDFHHAAGAAHGSVVFKCLDDAAFFAANSLVQDALVLTASFTLHFLRPAAAGELVARGKVVHRGRRQLLADAVATAGGKEVARGTGTFAVSDIPLRPEMGYR